MGQDLGWPTTGLSRRLLGDRDRGRDRRQADHRCHRFIPPLGARPSGRTKIGNAHRDRPQPVYWEWRCACFGRVTAAAVLCWRLLIQALLEAQSRTAVFLARCEHSKQQGPALIQVCQDTSKWEIKVNSCFGKLLEQHQSQCTDRKHLLGPGNM